MSLAVRRRKKISFKRGLTFEKVWAAMEEDREQQKETYRQLQEMSQKTDRRIAILNEQMGERHRETERKMAILNEQMGGLHNRFGEMAEFMVAPGIVDLFNDMGYHIEQAATHGYKIYGENRKIKTEIDLLMGNGDYIIAVEVKTSLGEKDIEWHRKRLELLREHSNKTGDRRKIRGGMAVAVLDEKDRKAILDAGFYLLEPSGDMMKMDLPEGFVPGEW